MFETARRRLLTALFSTLTLLLGGCEDSDLRIPYIPPTLANWPQPYRGMPGLRVHVFTTGTITMPEAMVLRGGSPFRTRELPVLAFVIAHPTQGLVVFNTGLTPAAPHESTARNPLRDFGFGPTVQPGAGLVEQMTAAGLRPDDVHWVVLSNLRAAHTGEVERLAQARVVVSKAEHTYARQTRSDYAARDVDDVSNWKFIDFDAARPLATFRAHVDLFGDGSLLLLDASGTTPGTMALLVRMSDHPLLLADDMAAVMENARYAVQPAAAADVAQWWEHVWRLKRFQDLVPELIVVPGHDAQPARAARSTELIVHEPALGPSAPPARRTPGVLDRVIPRPM